MKRCLLLVEGPFDRQRLAALRDLFDSSKLEIVSFGTDILTSKSYKKDPEKEIIALLAKEKLYELSDFDLVAQVCDTDGCFIDDSLVYEGTGHIVYASDHIEAKDKQSVCASHKQKAATIRSLLAEGKIKLYYNSCNIDHAFDGVQNPTDAFKKRAAIKMYNNARNDRGYFVRLLFEAEKTHSASFSESWVFIQEGVNSLMATSNLVFFLLDNYEYLNEEAKTLVDSCKKTH